MTWSSGCGLLLLPMTMLMTVTACHVMSHTSLSDFCNALIAFSLSVCFSVCLASTFPLALRSHPLLLILPSVWLWETFPSVFHYWFNMLHPYILAYKPTIFGWILRTKLWGSAYTRSHPLAARVNAAWTISRPLGRRVATEVRAAGSGTTHRLLLLLLLLHAS